MKDHKLKICLKCNENFDCNAADIENCGCRTIKLMPETITFLKKTNYNCLCSNCLGHINQLVAQAQNMTFPKQNEFVENVHYYIENGYWVFTELHHLLRGNCCKSGCRHCAYGFKK